MKPEDIDSLTGTFGIPELGTRLCATCLSRRSPKALVT